MIELTDTGKKFFAILGAVIIIICVFCFFKCGNSEKNTSPDASQVQQGDSTESVQQIEENVAPEVGQ